MTQRQLALLPVFLGFTALTAWALFNHGLVGWVPELLSTPIGITAAVDLVIALTIVVVWMWSDARGRGINPVPYLVVTLLTGSIGPLAYLLRRESRPAGTVADSRALA